MRALTTLAVVAAAGASAAVPAAAQGPSPSPAPAPGPSAVVEGASARFSWSMPPRYARGWRAWDAARARYAASYVQPSRWTVDLDACASSGGGAPITAYEFTIAGVGIDHTASGRGTACRHRFDALPRLGTYDVTVVVRTARSASAPRTERITLRDHFIVSLGDSMASGEGVPDEPGLYTPPFTLTQTLRTLERLFHKDFRPVTVEPARWQDRRCHRSARSGHALAARAIEDRDPHTSVTFVSLACSGATIADLLDTPYGGIQPPPGAEDLPPQLDQLRALVTAAGGRSIDAALVSIGINDLRFSDIVKDCAMNYQTLGAKPWGDSDCVTDKGTYAKTMVGGTLEQRYAELAAALRDRLTIRDVYIADYPGRPFGHRRGGCGLLGIPGIGIRPMEAQAMAMVGEPFAWTIGRATVANGWNWVPGMTKAFGPHHYCSSSPWLTRLESSILRQGTIHGAVHPNRTGHAAYGALLAKSIVLRAPSPHWRARLVIESVRVESSWRPVRTAVSPRYDKETGQSTPPPPPSDHFGFDFGVATVRNWPGRVTQRFTMPRSQVDQWVPVPAEAGVFELDVYDPPRPPRYPLGVDFLTYGPSGTTGGWHPYSAGFGAGCHEVRHPTGWSIRYRVEVGQTDAGPAAPVRGGISCQQRVAG